MSSGRWGGWSGKKDGKGNKSAAYGWLGNRGIVGQNWGGKCSIKKREGERSMALKGGGQEPFIPRFGCIPACLALILTASCYFFFFLFLPPDWLDPRAAFSLPDPNFSHDLMFAAGWKKGRRVLHACHFSFLTPLRQKTSPWTGWNSEWPFPVSDITCMRAGSQDGVYFFVLQHQSCCGNLWVEIRHSFLSQWKWGETGNIPCGTIGYQRPQWPLPVGHRHESGSNRLHNRLCRGLTVAFSFTTWIKCNCAVSQPGFHESE